MNTPNHEEGRASGMNALQALRSIQPPMGMQERVIQTLTERARLQAIARARGLRRYAWELWAGAAVAVAAVVVTLCVSTLHNHRTTTAPLEANLPAQRILPASPHFARQTIQAPLTAAHRTAEVRRHEPRKEVVADASRATIPHSAPPLPLTSQERLLIALAETPSLAASAAVSQPIRDHGLGANALFELGHQRLTPLRPVSLESTPLRPLVTNSIFSGENQ